MIPDASVVVANIIDDVSRRKIIGRGLVYKKLDDLTYDIKLATGSIRVRLEKGELEEGAQVVLKQRGIDIIIQPLSAQNECQSDSYSAAIDTANFQDPKWIQSFIKMLDEIIGFTFDPQITNDIRTGSFEFVEKTLRENLDNFNPELKRKAEEILKLISSEELLKQMPTSLLEKLTGCLRDFRELLFNNLESSRRNIVPIEADVQQGFVLFKNVNEAVEWLKKIVPPEQYSQARDIDIKPDSEVIVRIVQPDGKQNELQVILMSRERGEADLVNFFHRQLRSQLWSIVSAEDLIELFRASKGGIPTSRFEQIDSYLCSKGGYLLQSLGHSLKKLEPLVFQWMLSALDTSVSAEAAAERFPLYPAADLAEKTQQFINTFSSQLQKYPLNFSMEQFAVTETSFVPHYLQTELIPEIFANLGLTTEKEISTGQLLSRAQPNLSLKMQLYSLLNAFQLAMQKQNAEEPQDILSETQLRALVLSHRMSEEAETLINSFGRLHAELVQQFKSDMHNFSSLLKSRSDELVKQVEIPYNTILKLIETLNQKGIESLRLTVDNMLRALSDVVGAENRKSLWQKDAAFALKSLLQSFDFHTNEFINEVRHGLQQIAEKMPEQERLLLLEQAQRLNRIIIRFRAEMENHIRDFSHRLEQIYNMNADNTADRQNALSVISRQIEVILSKLESMQILARSTRIGDAVQQIISLPMKIDDRWTEVDIRLVKRNRKTKKTKEKDHYKVLINVAPPIAGDIQVNMDYKRNLHLDINISFEKKEARLWFDEHKTEILQAVKKLGIPKVGITLTSAKVGAAERLAPHKVKSDLSDGKSKIDISV